MDIYFKEEYAKIYELNGEGIVKVYSSQSLIGKVRYIFLKREIKLIKNKVYFDIITPYGYGGPQFFPNKESDLKELILEFKENFEKYCEKEKIISEFIRFHPLEKNHEFLENDMEIKNISKTIFMNLKDEEQIYKNIHSKCRNVIKKAIKNDVKIKIDLNNNNLEDFKTLYYKTMEKNDALEYYYFDNKYFENSKKLLNGNLVIFNAIKDEKTIATAMILKGHKYLHYHLSANTSEGYKVAANNLLLYEVAKWGYSKGFEKFHLGGGYGGDDSPLFKFKKAFNKDGILDFYIGKKIYNKKIYDLLVQTLEEKKSELKGENSTFFPLYRR